MSPAAPHDWTISEGTPAPLGVTWVGADRQYNLALLAPAAARVQLLLYGDEDASAPVWTMAFDPAVHRSWDTWHCRLDAELVAKVGARFYAYQVDSPGQPGSDWEKILLDPRAVSVHFPAGFSRGAACVPGSNAGRAPLGGLPPPVAVAFDWGIDRAPRHGSDLVVYELHVKGFTMRDAAVTAGRRGTYLGVIDKIPYLQNLGITAVELLPIFQFDPAENNYWGYSPLNFFAPVAAYASEPGQQVTEFREMVKALHAGGIEVVLDVVYNHTTEGNFHGPTYSFRGVANSTYYDMTDDGREYWDASGTGNSLNASSPAVMSLILDSLRSWVREMHVDGFRFDLATVLTRGEGGVFDAEQPLIHAMEAEPCLQDVRLIAEPWDAGGGATAYQLGQAWPGHTWRQWNGQFRDCARQFVKGVPRQVDELVTRLYGSDDLFPDSPPTFRRAYQSVNFVTCHDGFSLYDLVSYDDKHNLANGEHNRDGNNDNYSWNCGTEGEPATPEVFALRHQQVRNLLALVMLANGTAMFCAGDEFLNTQGGNNNPYNQDNETTWLDWSRLADNADVHRFFREMIAFRARHPSLSPGRFWRSRVTWYGDSGGLDASPDSHSLAFHLDGGPVGDDDLYVMVNAFWQPLRFTIQQGTAGEWSRVVDTSAPAPDDFREDAQLIGLAQAEYTMEARSLAVLIRRVGAA